MKRLAMSLAVMALIGANGAIVSARADDDRESTTLFTPRLSGTISFAALSMSAIGRCALTLQYSALMASRWRRWRAAMQTRPQSLLCSPALRPR
jgi:hypothetical protein